MLAPFNSTVSVNLRYPGYEYLEFIDDSMPILNQYQCINFGRKVKRANKAFERNHNQAVDLGVVIGIGNSEDGRVSPLKDEENLWSIPPVQNYSRKL